MEKAIKIYSDAYRQHGRSPASLLIPKGRQHERFTALCAPMAGDGFSVLDYGCGFGDLKPFLDARFAGVRYTGCDINPDFIRECRESHGAGADFRLVQSHTDVTDEFDYVIVSGIFNTLYHDSREEHWATVQEMLRHLFSRARRCFSFDFMTDRVDFIAPGAYHQDPIEAYRFVERELSRRLTLNQSYMPYEFAMVVYRDAVMKRPDNIY